MYKIYKIVDNTNGNNYVGITKQTLSQRLSHHKSKMICRSREIIKNGNYRIELIETTDDKLRERYWIENTDCINKYIPYRTKEEKKRYGKLYNKEYYENNRDKFKQQKKEYYLDNKQKLNQKSKQYREINRDKINQHSKEYYQDNKGEILEQKKKDYHYRNSWGGDKRNSNNLLMIDVNLFIN